MKLHTVKTKLLLSAIFSILGMSCNAGGLNLLGDDKVSLFIAGGGSELNVDTSLAPNTTLTNGALDDSGDVIELGIGYQYGRDYFITLAAQKNKLKIADITNTYGSINRLFSLKTTKPYLGLVAGYSKLDWSKRPHIVLLNEKLLSNSFMYGVQAGVDKKIRKNMSLFIKYQYIQFDHNIEILNNTSNIGHNSAQNVLIGMRYLF